MNHDEVSVMKTESWRGRLAVLQCESKHWPGKIKKIIFGSLLTASTLTSKLLFEINFVFASDLTSLIWDIRHDFNT